MLRSPLVLIGLLAILVAPAAPASVPAFRADLETFAIDNIALHVWDVGTTGGGSYQIADGALTMRTTGRDSDVSVFRTLYIDPSGGILEARVGATNPYQYQLYFVGDNGGAWLLFTAAGFQLAWVNGGPTQRKVLAPLSAPGTEYALRLILRDDGSLTGEVRDGAGQLLGADTITDNAVTPPHVRWYGVGVWDYTQTAPAPSVFRTECITLLPASAEPNLGTLATATGLLC